MAVDVCSTSEVLISPRISFSNDLKDTSSESNPTRSDQLLLSSTFDFSFTTTTNLTPADELFSNGKILPTQIKRSQSVKIHDDHISSKSQNSITTQRKRLKEFVFHEDRECEKPTHQRSFWQFSRSMSLNCDHNGKGPKGLLRSLSIKSLSRSNSTGSPLNPKKDSGPKVVEKPKESMFLRRCVSLNQPPPSSSSSSHVYYSFRNSNTSKTCKGGIKISPVLNIQPPFFGFGSFFCNGKVKKKTKS